MIKLYFLLDQVCNVSLLLGFPKLQMALISDIGNITDFTMGGINNDNTFPQLPKKTNEEVYFGTAIYDYFGVYHDKSIYFLPCNPDLLVTKYDVDENKHSTVPNSFALNHHVGEKVKGLRVGNYFWIMINRVNEYSNSPGSGKTNFFLWIYKPPIIFFQFEFELYM